MDRNWNQFLTRYHTATIPSPVLPEFCPNCGAQITWGWDGEEIQQWRSRNLPGRSAVRCGEMSGTALWAQAAAAGGRRVRIARIPRPDQTVFCPDCEAQILN